jgi:hypothetical protein
MDMTDFLETVPAVIGLAGLLTYFMREEKPASTVELVNVVRNVQTAFVLLGCATLILLSLWLFFRAEPPDRGAALSLPWITPAASYTGRQDSQSRTVGQFRQLWRPQDSGPGNLMGATCVRIEQGLGRQG